MPNPFDFLLSPIRRGVGGVRRGIGALEDQINPTRRQSMPQDADVNPAELDQVRAALPPSWNGTPNPATAPRPVMPNPNAPMMSDRPAMRGELTPAPGNAEGGAVGKSGAGVVAV